MTLTKKDLDQIRTVVTDVVDFAIEKSKMRMDERFLKIDREINDLIETNQAFLEKFDDHEQRITKLEATTI
ncbi:MAG TPA: hypothetical protein PK263_04475 [bacterium]|nr:hypothetical protein [bacterium]